MQAFPQNVRMLNLEYFFNCLDLHSSDRQSDSFLRKINRARFAMARTDSIRSVSGSLLMKVPYRRAASVPMHLLAKTLPNTTPAAKGRCSAYATSTFSFLF